MDRRSFLQTTGLGAAAALVSRTGVAAMPTTTAAPAESAPIKRLPARSEVAESDTWNLASIYPSDEKWDEAFVAWQKMPAGYAAFQGKLGESAEMLKKCIEFDLAVSREGDKLGVFAQLKSVQDRLNGTYQRMLLRFEKASSDASQANSFINPEILAIPKAKMEEFLEHPALKPYRLLLTRIVRFRPHTLTKEEEKLLAMQGEMAEASTQIFHQLLDADMKFGVVKNEKGEAIQLSHGSFQTFMDSPSVDVRRNAFHTYYEEFTDYQNTLAASLNGVYQRDIYYAKVRNFPTAIEAALFPDNVPVSVYDNLIASVHRQLPALYDYYDLRRRKMGLKEIHHYDCYVPILHDQKVSHTFDQAIELALAAVEPLGSAYHDALEHGLKNRWCDRYENRGKESGAFSSGCFDSQPFILMNYQPGVLDHVFTLIHESGHSMHSYLSNHNQPYQYHEYTLFVAEVASTFNENLLSKYMLKRARSKQEHAFLLNRQIDAVRATIFRQTMFAEFEKLAHASAEAGEPLTTEQLKNIYHGLLKLYFGPHFTLDKELDVECLRVPHFYRGFYVYKYATSMSAAMALADIVTKGGAKELNNYLGFLKGGCSKDPLDLLRGAGVDLEKPDTVDLALSQFAEMVKELDTLI